MAKKTKKTAVKKVKATKSTRKYTLGLPHVKKSDRAVSLMTATIQADKIFEDVLNEKRKVSVGTYAERRLTGRRLTYQAIQAGLTAIGKKPPKDFIKLYL